MLVFTFITALLVWMFYPGCEAPPIHSGVQPEKVENDLEAIEYLNKFAYLDRPRWQPNGPIARISDGTSELIAGLLDFQGHWRLNVTGKLDDETRELMNLPRCENQDVEHPGDVARRRRYILEGSKWKKFTLTYRVLQYPKTLTPGQTHQVVRRAFDIWETASPLRFRKISKGTADIQILFQGGYHGDPYPFDGEGRTLAHAFYPQYGGEMHFDGDEIWTNFSKEGKNLFHVAAHEIGHAIGLGHSDKLSALMAPFYRPYNPDFELTEDDIQGIQFLYPPPLIPDMPQDIPSSGEESGEELTTDSATPLYPPSSACYTGELNAITMHLVNGDERIYAFRGDYYMLLDEYGVVEGFPRLIKYDWLGLPGHVDAALYWETKYNYTFDHNRIPINRTVISPAATFFFRGPWFWKFQEGVMVPGHPKRIRDHWEGVPDNVDAVLKWGGNGHTYFFKDDQYYKYDRGSGRVNNVTYPETIHKWRGLPGRIDAAFRSSNGRSYFFHGEYYYRFDDYSFKIDRDYPRPTAYWWLGCRDTPSWEMAPIVDNGKDSTGNGVDSTDKMDSTDVFSNSPAAFIQPQLMPVLITLTCLGFLNI